MRLVVTRPQDDGERSAALLRARGHQVLVAPLLRIEAAEADLGGGYGGVVVTSANAINAVAAHPARARLFSLPLFAVGARSAEAARQAGFSAVESAGGDLRGLVRMLEQSAGKVQSPLLYLAGEDRAGDLVGELAARGIHAELAVVYRAVPLPFPAALADALNGAAIDAVLHYSARSAASYVAGAQAAGVITPALAVRHVCLSEQTAAPLRAAGAADVAVASRADEAALFARLDG